MTYRKKAIGPLKKILSGPMRSSNHVQLSPERIVLDQKRYTRDKGQEDGFRYSNPEYDRLRKHGEASNRIGNYS